MFLAGSFSLQDSVSQVLCSHSQLRSVCSLHSTPHHSRRPAGRSAGSSCPQSVTVTGTVSAGALFLQRSPSAWDKPDVYLRGSWQVTWGRKWPSVISLARKSSRCCGVRFLQAPSSRASPRSLGMCLRMPGLCQLSRQGLRPTPFLYPARKGFCRKLRNCDLLRYP